MKLIAYLYQQSSRLLSFAIAASIVSGVSGAMLMAVINAAITGSKQQTTLAWVFLGLCILHPLSRFASSVSLLNLTQSAICRLRIDLSKKLLATPQTKLQAIGKPRLLVILTQDINTAMQACQRLTIVLAESVIIISCLVYVLFLSWKMLLIFLFLLLAGMAVITAAERGPLRHLAQARERLGNLYHHFRGLIEGSRELQVNASHGATFIKQIVVPEATDIKRTFVRGIRAYMLVLNAASVLYSLVIGVVLFVVPHWIQQPPEIIISITIALVYLGVPISELMKALPELRQGNIALKKIRELDNELTAETPPRHIGTVNPFGGGKFPIRLELSGVCHHYPGEIEDTRFMLGPIDLTIQQGEAIFIVGGNGSGKTTLAMLLLGLYEPNVGSIFLNHKPVTTENLEFYRQHFSVIFSDFHLFENLLDSKHEALNTRAEHYISLLGIEHKVRVKDGRFSTIDLSTGQRKRLALVAAFLEDRPIYLFDEWAADQDPVFKRVFYTQLLPDLKARGKTVLVITHDEQYFSYADRVIKLKDGLLCDVSMPHASSHAVVEHG